MTLLVLLPWFCYLLVLQKGALLHRAKFCCVVIGTVILIALPWTLRNNIQLGSFVVRTGLGLNIYFSNNDCSRTDMIEDLKSGCAAIYQPNFNLNEARAFRDLGEVQYDRERLAEAEVWMRTHPGRFLGMTSSRFAAFWFPRTVEHPFKTTVIWLFTLLSVPGLILMCNRNLPLAIFMILVLSVYPLVYYVIVSDVRYRYPVLWLSLLPAGYFVDLLFQNATTRRICASRVS